MLTALKYEFLVHAILGLAAQHLTAACTTAEYSVPALNHRLLAITALNEALSRPCLCRSDGDARWAAAIVLTFQSSYMADGMMEFLGMMRGWMVIQTSVVLSTEDSFFRRFTEEAFVESMRSLLVQDGRDTHDAATLGTADEGLRRILGDFASSLRIVAPLCKSVAELSLLDGEGCTFSRGFTSCR
jgi:hypothetical protein